jgi:YesN/AraC family two-component response regulator
MIGIIKSSMDQISSKILVETPNDLPSLMSALGKISGDLSVLLVDDEPEILTTCQSLLGRFFGKVDVASNGQEALDMIINQNHHYDIVITDINMPLMNGYKMSLKLRELKPEIAIIVLSAHAESSYLLDFIAIDIDGYCSKPVDGLSLFKAIYKVVSRIYYIKVCEQNTHTSHVCRSRRVTSTLPSKPAHIQTYIHIFAHVIVQAP